ncbi:MAG: substrate-binding domain-containing protein [Pseudomonadota bacterium]
MKLKLAALSAIISSSAFSAVGLKGSDTLAGLMTDAIVAAGLEGEVNYLGTGSGNGEKAVAAGEQAIAPMSREMKPEVKAALAAKGLTVVEHKIALDAIAMLAKDQNGLPIQLDLETIKAIYTCKITDWASIPGSKKTGAIRVLRRDDASGTTDAFKHFTGVKEFGACVTALASTDELSVETSTDDSALAYSGLSGKRAGNKIIPLYSDASGRTSPTVVNIRSFKYPFARFLYVYEVPEKLTSAEKSLVEKLADRTFLDPIVQNNGFITLD